MKLRTLQYCLNNRRFRSFDRRPSTAFATCLQDRAVSRRNDCAHPPSPILLPDRVISFCAGGRNGREHAKEISKSKGTKHGASGHPLAGTLYRPGIDPWDRFIGRIFSGRLAQARAGRTAEGRAGTGCRAVQAPAGAGGRRWAVAPASTDRQRKPPRLQLSRARAGPILAGRPRPLRRRTGKHRPERLIFIVPTA